MIIERAQHAGFCSGVKNAVTKVEKLLAESDEPVYVYGELIHNPQVIKHLTDQGLQTIHDLSSIDCKHIAVRTHGILISELREIYSRSKKCLNLTCSRVSQVQSIIKKYSEMGYFVLIAGDADHAEVLGLQSYAEHGYCIIPNCDAIQSIPDAENYVLVSQTTFEELIFLQIQHELTHRIQNLTVFNTICYSTHERQNEVEAAASRGVDTIVVVGGKNSANTLRLVQIGKNYSLHTIHIETADELTSELFSDSKHIYITAGASTPEWIINTVLDKIKSYSKE